MAANRTSTFSRRIQQARYNKVAAPVTLLPWALTGDRSASKPIILPALGLNITAANAAWPQPFINLKCAPRFAYWYVEQCMTSAHKNNVASKYALVMGELVALWACENPITNHLVTTCRGIIEASALSNPPTGDRIASVAKFLLKEASEVNKHQMVTKAEFCANLGIEPRDDMLARYPEQKYYWLRHRGNCIPYKEFFGVDDAYMLKIANLNDLQNGAWQELTPLPDLAPVQGFMAVWTASTVDVHLGCLEAWSYRDQSMDRAIVIASAFHLLTVLAKQGNVTEDWVESRRTRIKSMAPEVDIDRWITTDTIREFNLWYPGDKLTSDQAYSMMQAMYTWLDEENLGPYKWIIEQSATANITLAIAFCEAVSRCMLNPLALLMGFIKEDEFKTVAYICGAIQYDRFCSLKDPPKKMSEYADLAYLGKFVSLMDKGKKATGYIGDPTAWISLSESDLKKIARQILAMSDTPISLAGGFESNVRRALPNQGLCCVEGKWYKVEAPTALAADATEDQRARFEAHSELLRRSNQGETVTFDDIEIPVRAVGMGELVHDYNEAQHAKYKAYMLLFTSLVTNARQLKLALIDDTRVNGDNRCTRLPEDMVQAFAEIGVTIPAEWNQPPTPIPAVAVDETKVDKDFNLLSRAVLVPPFGAARNAAAAAAEDPAQLGGGEEEP